MMDGISQLLSLLLHMSLYVFTGFRTKPKQIHLENGFCQMPLTMQFTLLIVGFVQACFYT